MNVASDQINNNLVLNGGGGIIEESNESYGDYLHPKIPRWLFIVLIVVGVLGNTLSLVVFSQKHMRKNSTFIYLAFLSVVDIFVLCFGLGDLVLISYLNFIIRNRSSILCRLHSFLTYVFTHLSSFLLATVSIDRAIATNFITFSKIYCKPKTAYKVIFLATMLSVLINFHCLIFLGYEKTIEKSTQFITNQTGAAGAGAAQNSLVNNKHNYTNIINSNVSLINYFNVQIQKKTYECASVNGTLYDKFFDPYFQWIDLFSYAIVPFITMAICTFLIIRAMFNSSKRLKKPEPTKKTSNANIGNTTNNSNNSSPASKALIQNKQQKNANKKTNSRTNKTKHLTYTLITINALFFCLVSPLVISLSILKGRQTVQDNKFLFNIVYILSYSNHSFNFVLYGISSPPYRETLVKLLGLSKSNASTSNINNNNHKNNLKNQNKCRTN